MTAIIITVGTELTEGRVLDTNTAFLAGSLEARGLKVILSLSVPDLRQEIGQAVNFALEKKSDLIVLAGGLGPTEDDLTASAVAAALGLELQLNPEAESLVRQAVGATGPLEPHQAKQAVMPSGGRVIRPVGTAPGFILTENHTVMAVLPGVPREIKAMWGDVLRSPQMAPVLSAARPPARGRLGFYGVREIEVDQAVERILGKAQAAFEVSICSRRGEVLLEVSSPGDFEDQIQALLKTLKKEFGLSVYSEGEEIETVVAAQLARAGATLAVGESCTGGMLGEVITRVAGSSAFFLGGVTAYSNDVKKSLLKVRQEILDNTGAVSKPVAQQLALGARSATGADYGAGITGVAGPSGGTPEKPVGLVYICVSSSTGDVVERFNFSGGRDDIREAAVTAALHMLHLKVTEDEAPGG